MKRTVLLNIVKYIFSFGFAFGILYLLFKDQDPLNLIEETKQVNGKWIILSMIFGGWAYVSRGLRWIVLIDALGYKSSRWNSISAVSIGYFTNLFIPRAGEISRCTSLNQVEKIPVDKLFGTILVERVIDFIALFGLLFITMLLNFNNILSFYSTLQEQNVNSVNNNNYLLFFGILILLAILFIFSRKWIKKSPIYNQILRFIEGLKEGVKSIKKMNNKNLFWIHTFSIWIMYFLMTYICFFSIEATSHLTVSDGLFLLVLGGIGMVIPTPGGIGSYHAIVMIGLSVLGVGSVFLSGDGDPTNPALLFPTIVHAAQTLVAMIMGSIGLLILFLSNKKRNVKS
tara:strand:+ start:4949 stop:5974 length:1026 start_codon:yes stop_codon:yes gene_type:complete